jgi:hypothetical protein
MGNNNKLFSYILIALLGISALLSILYIAGIFVSEGGLIFWCYILLGIAAVIAVAFPIITMAQNPKGAKNALIGVGALVLVCGIGYLMSGSEVHTNLDGDLLAGGGTSKLSETGLIAFYILIIIAIGSIIFAEISKAIK